MSGMVVCAGPVPAAGLGPAARLCSHRGRTALRGRGVRYLRAALPAAVWTISAMLMPASAQRLTLHYQERPPYSAAGIDGHVHGLLATPAARRAGIARHAREPLATRAEPLQMLQMLRSGRADWTIASAEDAALHVDDTLVALAFSGQPPGPTRHLYCSADFPDDWLARLDAALAAVETGDGTAAERR